MTDSAANRRPGDDFREDGRDAHRPRGAARPRRPGVGAAVAAGRAVPGARRRSSPRSPGSASGASPPRRCASSSSPCSSPPSSVRLARGCASPGRRRAAAFARVEQATGALHRPATAFTDRLASRPDDPTGQALWEAHRRRMLASLDRLRAGLPAPRLAAHDPYALRFLVAAALRRRLRHRRAGAHRPPRRGLPRRREHGRGHRPHRRLGDAAGLYRPRADLPDRRGRQAAGHRIFRARSAASSPCAPAAPTIWP